MSNTTAAESPDGPLAGWIAIITGASRGIGLECARRLLAAGAELFLLGRDPGVVDLFMHRKPWDPGVSFEQWDLADASAVARIAPSLRRQLEDHPGIIINNAGHFFLAPTEQTSLADFQRTLQINLTAPFAIIRELLPQMRKRGRGHVVTVGSIADHRAFPGNAAYAASKYGVRGLHEVLREELRGSGIRTTLISPGPTNTDLWNPVNPDEREGFTKRADMLSPSAVADAVLYALTAPIEVNIDELRLSRS
ncbi:MAG TPA: SDR family oxidoreductase [Gemmatimonadaceae bacterium]|nr:SDR family oxidoreductase [Gemmatimonadaceae bacterium]